MSVSHEVKGNKLIITVDLDAKRTQSKSALAKAAEKGLDASTVPASMIANSGGFVRAGDAKYSLNVIAA